MPGSSYTLQCAAPSPKIVLSLGISGPPSYDNWLVPWAHPTHHPKRHRDEVGRFCTVHARYQRTARKTDRRNEDGTRPARTGRSRYRATPTKQLAVAHLSPTNCRCSLSYLSLVKSCRIPPFRPKSRPTPRMSRYLSIRWASCCINFYTKTVYQFDSGEVNFKFNRRSISLCMF